MSAIFSLPMIRVSRVCIAGRLGKAMWFVRSPLHLYATRLGAGLVVLLLLLPLQMAHASDAPRCEPWTARLAALQGSADLRSPGSSEWTPAVSGQIFCPGDRIRVAADSRAVIELRDETILRLDQKTTLLLPQTATQGNFWVDLSEGAIYLLSRIKRQLEIRTPFVNAGLEGTEFVVRVQPDYSLVAVLEGRVAVANDQGYLQLGAGQSAIAQRGAAPVMRLDIRPEDAVHWALHYPRVVAHSPTADTNTVLEVQAALVVGNTEQAQQHLDAALDRDPANATLLGLRSVVALVQNANDDAMALAEQAVGLAPQDTAALLALSYARQAAFDLAGARDATERALRSAPQNALVWARSAELLAALGEHTSARQAALRATELAPDLARANTVLGFVLLAELDLAGAAARFQHAAMQDPSDPLPRLGAGLVSIRQGALDVGVRELEVAVSLDPARALLRSYLGKAYVEQNRGRVGGVEFDRAKALDPNDPTPWLYGAMRRLDANEPIAGLREIERSISLNDNRAVTRSRLLLDQDSGARAADQGQIYRELGFERLIPGISARSLIGEPGSPGLHLLQSKATQPRQQSARVSELLQWQMNAPLTTNLLPLQQTESDLVITSAADLLAPTGDEWSQMFSRDGTFIRLNAVSGANNLLSNDLNAGVQFGRVVVGMAQYHYQFDGYADNNDQERDILGASVQWQAAPDTIVFAEYRDDEQSFGDLSLGYDARDLALDFRTERDAERWRVGIRHQLAPSTDMLLTATGFSVEERQADLAELVPGSLRFATDSTDEEDGWMAEVQIIHRADAQSVTAGGGIFMSETDSTTDATLESLIPGLGWLPVSPVPVPPTTSDSRQRNAYVYWSREMGRDLDATVGLAYDDYRSFGTDDNQFSPKLGLLWRAADGLQVRAAALRALKRSLVAEQTLEPTQVAGFTQMFDDPNGTDSRLIGLAVDGRIAHDLYVGAEITRRDLKVPFDNGTERTERNAEVALLYGYWMPTDRLALRAEVRIEELDADRRFPLPDKPWSTLSADTLQLPLSLSYHMPSGITARTTLRWVDQDVELVDTTMPGPVREESDEFWTTSLSFDYRLPRRLGRISVGVENLFDEQFGYQETDLNDPTLARERTWFARLNLAL